MCEGTAKGVLIPGRGVLLVDDETAVLRSLSRLFARRGWRCESADSGLLALGRLAEGGFHALVADFRMEPFDGIELCRRARLAGFTGPMLLHSGFVTPEVRATALRSGVHAVVPKDTDAEALAEQLSSLCELRDYSRVPSAPHPASMLAGMLELSPHETLLLSELARVDGPLTARTLIVRIWGRSGNRKLFDITLRRLNDKLAGSGWVVRNAGRGRGYEIVRDVGPVA